jgi:hypothetical protein
MYIPLFWLSLLSSTDIENAQSNGQYELDRKRALEHSLGSLPFLSTLFPQVPTFGEISHRLVAKLRASRSAMIGIEVVELVCEDDHGGALPTIGAAIKAIESRDPGYSLALPARTIPNPFRPSQSVRLGGKTLSIHELLMEVCLLQDQDLESGSQEAIQCSIIGHVWD